MKKIVIICSVILLLANCTTQQKVVKIEPQIQEIKNDERVLKRKVAIVRFSNETQYAKGVFYNKENDPIGKQALDILSAKLSASDKFILLERSDMDAILEELKLANNESLQKIGADYLLIGSVTEFGRKTVGDVNAFSRTKSQIVQAAVSIRMVDVSTGQIIYSEEAKGEAETTNRTVMGYGERTDYDATLNDQAISIAISKLVENIINNCMNKPWKSYFLSYDENGIFISGGKTQGLRTGDIFDVLERGKSVKNPQTGMMMELPGKKAGKIKVDFMGGNDPQNEFSLVSFIEGSIDKTNIENYYIQEIEK